MFVKSPDSSGTPRVTRRSCSPRHGFAEPPHRATPQSARRARPLAWPNPARSPRRRCLLSVSAADQLSRAPAGSLDSRARGLAPFRPNALGATRRSPHRRAGDETEPSATAPDSRVNGVSGLEQWREWESHHRLHLMITFPRRGGPAFPGASLRRLFWPCVGRDDLRADNPLSHPPADRTAPIPRDGHREPLPRAALLTQRASKTRDAFTR
jgi:hypothetical protein